MKIKDERLGNLCFCTLIGIIFLVMFSVILNLTGDSTLSIYLAIGSILGIFLICALVARLYERSWGSLLPRPFHRTLESRKVEKINYCPDCLILVDKKTRICPECGKRNIKD